MTDVEIWRRVLLALAVSRLLMIAGVVLAIMFGGLTPGTTLVGTLEHGFFRWDSNSYTGIAATGYPTAPTDPSPDTLATLRAGHYSPHLNNLDAFLPGYPMVLRVMSLFTGGDYEFAGLLVSLLAEAIALFFIFRLVLRERDSRAATFAIWAMVLAPFAVFLGAIYTESMFIAAAAAALYFMRAGRFRDASIACAIACATRITGVALLVALLIEYQRQHRTRITREAFWMAIAPLPFLLYAVYMQVHAGDAFAMLDANTVFYNHTTALPWNGLAASWDNATHPSEYQFAFFYEVVFGLGGVAICIAAWLMRFPKSFAAYGTVVVLTAICITFWRSVPRYELALFPFSILLTDVTERRREVAGAVLGASAVAFIWGSMIFTQGGWLA